MGFWKNEWQLFLNDMQELGEFFLQPVTFGKQENLMLRPTKQEAEEKAETSSFWKREIETFNREIDAVYDFLFQPVTFK